MPLFVTRSTVQYRVIRLCRRAGVNTHPGALVYGLPHTFATDLASANEPCATRTPPNCAASH